ncbi:MAG: hypothetical protein R6V03_00020 [Kiritimatiellia bacterium]
MTSYLKHLALVAVLLTVSTPAIASSAGSRFGPIPEKGRVVAALHLSTEERDAVEYDDRYSPDYTGGYELESDSTLVELCYGLNDSIAAGFLFGLESTVPNTGGPSEDATMMGVSVRCDPLRKGVLPFDVGIAFQYLASEKVNEGNSTVYWERWELAFDASKEWREALFYGGVRYSDLAYVYTHQSSYGTREGGLDASDNVGLFLGISYEIVTRAVLSLEYRLIDVDGGSMGLAYRF